MYLPLRIILSVIVALAVHYLVSWFLLITVGENYWILNLVSILLAIAAGWFIWRSTEHGSAHGLAYSIFFGAFMAGGIGFLGGFLGPIVFMPSANQGPMLGIFIMGPLGFLIGAFGGLLYWLVKGKRRS